MQELDSLDVDLGENSEVVVSSLLQSAVAPVICADRLLVQGSEPTTVGASE